MSDDDKIAELTKAYAKLERMYRLPLLFVTVAIAAAGLFNMAGSLLLDGRLALGNALRWAAMTMLGLTACYGAMCIYRVWKKQNAEIVGLYRQLATAVEMFSHWKPFFDAIHEAHRQGHAAVIEPGEAPADKPPERLH